MDPIAQQRQWSAQGSITIRRIKNGDALYMTFGSNGIPLYQNVDDDGVTIAPDWTKPECQPIVIPQVTAASGASVVITDFIWKYNGVALGFSSTATSWTPSTGTYAGKFLYDPETHAIRVIDNLAQGKNVSNGMLSCDCIAVVGECTYRLSKSIDVILVRGGASSYYGAVTATNLTLSHEMPTSVLTASLYCGGVPVSSYYVRWCQDSDANEILAGQNTLTVTRDGVNGSRLYIAKFYLTSTDTNPVAMAGVTVIDAADTWHVRLQIISTQQFVDDSGTPVTVKAILYNAKTGAEQSKNVLWRMDVVDPETFSSIRSVDGTDTINITLADTDRKKTVNGKQITVSTSVDVMADANWIAGFNAFTQEQTKDLVDLPYRADDAVIQKEPK